MTLLARSAKIAASEPCPETVRGLFVFRVVTMSLVLYIVALALLVCAAVGVGSRVQLGWLGLAVWLFTAAILPAL